MLCQTHIDEALPGDDVWGAAIVDEDVTYVASGEVHGVFAYVCADDEGDVMWVVLKSKVRFGECDWDMGPGGAEMLAFAHMRDCAEIFFPLLLRLVDRLV